MPVSSPCAPADGWSVTRGQTGQLRQDPFEAATPAPAHPCETLLGRQRVRGRESGQPRHLLVDPRVVLHRAGAQRIQALVDREVQARKPREVARDLDLRDLGLPRDLAAQQRRGDRRRSPARRAEAASSRPCPRPSARRPAAPRAAPGEAVRSRRRLFFDLHAHAALPARAATRRSISALWFISVTATRNRRVSFASQRDKRDAGEDFLPGQARQQRAGVLGRLRPTNSLKVGAA